MIVTRGLGSPRRGSIVAAGLTLYPTITPPIPAAQDEYHGGGLDVELVEGYYELVERRQAASERVSRGTEQILARPIMVRVPGTSEITEIAVPDGVTLTKARMTALLLALSELDD